MVAAAAAAMTAVVVAAAIAAVVVAATTTAVAAVAVAMLSCYNAAMAARQWGTRSVRHTRAVLARNSKGEPWELSGDTQRFARR